jgi:hypothetical protein
MELKYNLRSLNSTENVVPATHCFTGLYDSMKITALNKLGNIQLYVSVTSFSALALIFNLAEFQFVSMMSL